MRGTKLLPNLYPGEILMEFLKPMNLSQTVTQSLPNFFDAFTSAAARP